MFYALQDAIAAVQTAAPYTPSKKAITKAAPRDQDAGHTTDTAMYPATTDFVGMSLPETVVEPAGPTDHMTYNSAYEYQETPAAEALTATPQRRVSSPSPR